MVLRKLVDREPYPWDIPISLQRPPAQGLHYCCLCKQKKTDEYFSRDASTPSGWAFACNRCRKQTRRRSWRDGPQEGQVGNYPRRAPAQAA
jgi:hypothetical protein